MITLLLIIIYGASLVKVKDTYLTKRIDSTFWSIIFLFCPGLNTILAIRLTKREDLLTPKAILNSLRSFFKKLELYDN